MRLASITQYCQGLTLRPPPLDSEGRLAAAIAAFMALRLAGSAASAFVLVLSTALVLDRIAADGRPGLSSVLFAGVGTGMAASAVSSR